MLLLGRAGGGGSDVGGQDEKDGEDGGDGGNGVEVDDSEAKARRTAEDDLIRGYGDGAIN